MGTPIWSLGGREPFFCTVLIWETNKQEEMQESVTLHHSLPSTGRCDGKLAVGVSENGQGWQGEFKDLSKKEVTKEL